jgi:hypothetical protein
VLDASQAEGPVPGVPPRAPGGVLPPSLQREATALLTREVTGVEGFALYCRMGVRQFVGGDMSVRVV